MLLKDVDLSKIVPADHGLLRSGIIPYIKRNDDIYFLLGIDTKTGEYSDFGGGVKMYENALSAALRECREESRGLIDFKDLGLIRRGILSRRYRQNVCIMFSEIRTPGFYENSKNIFHSRKTKYNEMSDIIWIPSKEMLKISQLNCKNSKMWIRIRYALSICGIFNRKFIEDLKNL
jgi:8-oxo-dGTP pyrophosphatase MutT (NUDIX family)